MRYDILFGSTKVKCYNTINLLIDCPVYDPCIHKAKILQRSESVFF